MAYVGNTCYMREYASLTFTANNVHHSDILQMKEPQHEPYVTVQDVKWATGNFIHYGPENGGYWGIAPTQWWISRRAVMLGSNRKEVSSGGILQSSQFESSPKQTTDDVDLFRFGSIAKALSFTGFPGLDTWGENEISQKISPDGKHGDIVWYYTKDNKRKYRMPTEDELRKLYTVANVIPAYCYTDKGTVVYGAFFTNNASNDADKRKKAFPTKVKEYYKYTNVTALVRANKGLFLPVTGRRSDGVAVIGYRDMAYGAGAYGQYMSSTSSVLNWDFLFGPTEWNFSKNSKAQAKAIRPVWDESSTTGTDPVYPAFQNIK